MKKSGLERIVNKLHDRDGPGGVPVVPAPSLVVLVADPTDEPPSDGLFKRCNRGIPGGISDNQIINRVPLDDQRLRKSPDKQCSDGGEDLMLNVTRDCSVDNSPLP